MRKFHSSTVAVFLDYSVVPRALFASTSPYPAARRLIDLLPEPHLDRNAALFVTDNTAEQTTAPADFASGGEKTVLACSAFALDLIATGGVLTHSAQYGISHPYWQGC